MPLLLTETRSFFFNWYDGEDWVRPLTKTNSFSINSLAASLANLNVSLITLSNLNEEIYIDIYSKCGEKGGLFNSIYLIFNEVCLTETNSFMTVSFIRLSR